MLVGESKNWKTTKIRAELNLHCIGLGNPNCQLVVIKGNYYKTEKLNVCLNMAWFAKSGQKGCAVTATKTLIY